MKNLMALLVVVCAMTGCGQKETSFKAAQVKNEPKTNVCSSFSVERMVLDSVNTSSYGESFITHDGRIAFMDERLCTLSKFDTSGRLLNTSLGSGPGPTELQIGRVAGQAYLNDGRLALLGYNLDFHVVKPDLKSKDVFVVNRKEEIEIDKSSMTYTNQYSDMVCRSYQNHVYFNMYSEHPDFNYLDHMDDYLAKCRHIWKIDVDAKEDKGLFLPGYPESYQEEPYENVPFLGTCFDLDKQGNFYVKYDKDSLIYEYSHDFEPIRTYGYAGEDMNLDYQAIHSYKESRKVYRSERNTRGYYYWIEYVDETGLLFVSYRKDSEESDGLQVYKDGRLIADVIVPKTFRVMGYVAPYYYSYVIPLLDEDDDSLIMYRFQMGE